MLRRIREWGKEKVVVVMGRMGERLGDAWVCAAGAVNSGLTGWAVVGFKWA